MTDAQYFLIVAAASLALSLPLAAWLTWRAQATPRRPLWLEPDAPAPAPPVVLPTVAPRPPRRLAARPVYPFEAALRAVADAEVRVPLNGHSHAVIVASTDAAFIARVRAAVAAVPDVDVTVIAGIAAPDPRDDPEGRGRCLWGECLRDGLPSGPEPRRRYPLSTLAHSQAYYWLIRPAAGTRALPGDSAPALPGPGAPFADRARQFRVAGGQDDWLDQW